MGRFETAAEFYRFREPYPAEFFETVAARLNLSKQTRVLDVGCGPGNLAIGFSPLVGTCRAIDLEPEMLRLAHAEAAEAKVDIQFEQMAIEEFEAPDGAFDFVTIGRALHWLPREATLAVFEQSVAAGGCIAVCATGSASSPWALTFRKVRHAWSSDPDESRYRPDLDLWFAPSRFRKVNTISVTAHTRVTLDDLVRRALSFSITSPAVLGDRRPEFEQHLRTALSEFAVDGVLNEEITANASVFR
jgi:SAM-dependent methyltransferase